MFCTQCGKELNDDANFCHYCGTKVLKRKENIFQNNIENDIKNYEYDSKIDLRVEKGPWKGFAVTGFILGIICLSTFIFVYPAIELGIFGIIFSALGRKSKVANGKATIGLVFSIVSFVLAIFVAIFIDVYF